jgi:hypothetical protein
MWGARRDRERTTVVCIACGTSLLRDDAREYDKEGDRWDRHDKEFEYLCKECHRGLCHQPRDDLESLLVSVESDGATRSEFLARYVGAVEERYGAADADADTER